MVSKDSPQQWAIERARQLAQAEATTDIGNGQNLLGLSCYTMALARLIEQHEQPPVDPDVEAVKRIINAYVNYRLSDHGYWDGKAESLTRAVAQYKQEVENRG